MEDYPSQPIAEPLLSGADTRSLPLELISDIETSGEPLYMLTTEGGYLTAVYDRGEPGDPHYNTVTGKQVEFADMRVHPGFTRQGIATELVRIMAQEMAARGAVGAAITAINPVVMRVLVRVFGMDRLTIYDGEAATVALPLDGQQAAASIERASAWGMQREELGLPLPGFSYGLRVNIDLTDVTAAEKLPEPTDNAPSCLRF